jgi:hypothetical protein
LLVAPMKPISLPLPFLGLIIRIEAAQAARWRAAASPPPISLARDSLRHVVSRRVLQDVGLDNSRQD